MLINAAVLTTFGQPMEMLRVDLDDPGPGEVRVKILASGVCGSDTKVWAGKNPLYQATPIILGHESIGIVESTGPLVESVSAGDPVLISMNRVCGRCLECAGGRQYLCTSSSRALAVRGRLADGSTRLRYQGKELLPFIGIGSFAEMVVVGESMLVPIPAGEPDDFLALLTCGVITGVGAVTNIAHVRPGDSVLVVGCGGVGLNVIQGAALSGAARIIGADTNPDKLNLARQFGATDTILADADLAGAVARIEPLGTTFAFDVTGAPGVAAAAMASIRPGGTTVLVGSPPYDSFVQVPPALFFGDRTLRGCVGGNANPARDLPALLGLVRAGKLQLEPLISERISLGQASDALHRQLSGEVARSLIVF